MACVAVLRPFGNIGIHRKRVLRIPMASEAVAHAHRHVLIHDIHGLHFAMTSLAENAGAHVRPVIKINVVRQGVNPLPFQRRSRSIHGRDLLNIRAVCLCHFVAVHAFIHRRNSCLARFQSSGMTIETGNFQGARMELMRIRNRLLRLIASSQPVWLRVPAYTENCRQHCHKADRQYKFRQVQKIPTRLAPQVHLEPFLKLRRSFLKATPSFS
jgi:hypothetical protein